MENFWIPADRADELVDVLNERSLGFPLVRVQRKMRATDDAAQLPHFPKDIGCNLQPELLGGWISGALDHSDLLRT
jgi:hypothetical protein